MAIVIYLLADWQAVRKRFRSSVTIISFSFVSRTTSKCALDEATDVSWPLIIQRLARRLIATYTGWAKK